MAKTKGSVCYIIEDVINNLSIDKFNTTNDIAKKSNVSFGVALRLLKELEEQDKVECIDTGDKHKVRVWRLKQELEKQNVSLSL